MPGQLCCKMKNKFECEEPLVDDGASFITQELMTFASDGTYLKIFKLGTGGCPEEDGDSTVSFQLETLGDYELQGENDEIEGFTKIAYTPKSFTVALAKNNKAIYFTVDSPGACMEPEMLLNDPTVGCPCGGTWEVDGNFIAGEGYAKRRTIVPSECPEGTCPMDFFFNQATEYGNLRYNEAEQTLDLTATDESESTGYGIETVEHGFRGDGECVSTTDTSKASSIMQAGAGALFTLVSPLLLL